MNTKHIIPDEIFAWLELCPFDELNGSQQKVVMQFFSKEEYTELYNVHSLLNNASIQEQKQNAMKFDLLKMYDAKHGTGTKYLWSDVLWKAAAVLFFITSGFLVFKSFDKTQIAPAAIVQRDTVYIKQDTVYAIAETKQTVPYVKNKEEVVRKKSKVQKVETPLQTPTQTKEEIPLIGSLSSNELSVMNIKHADRALNVQKRNSKKYDSLEQNFQFVSL